MKMWGSVDLFVLTYTKKHAECIQLLGALIQGVGHVLIAECRVSLPKSATFVFLPNLKAFALLIAERSCPSQRHLRCC